MAATMKDIARLTGLSLATISKHLNGGRVLDENRIKIEQAIADLDFHVNEFARGLKTNKSKTIGVILPDLPSFFCTSVAISVEDVLSKRGYISLISDSRLSLEHEGEIIRKMLGRRVDGIIAMPLDSAGASYADAESQDIPIILIDRILKKSKSDAVTIDNYGSFYTATESLIKEGHKKIAVISVHSETRSLHKRLSGYKDALKDNRIPFNSKYMYNDSQLIMLTGYNGVKNLLSLADPPTAILCLCSELTLGAYVALTELHKKMPEEISFIGFDLLNLSLISTVELTTIVPPIDDVVETAIDILLSRIEGRETRNICQRMELRCAFKKGTSSGPPPKNA